MCKLEIKINVFGKRYIGKEINDGYGYEAFRNLNINIFTSF